ncbi:MAG TPA: hypothetical protein VLC09_04805, partial [Polyangiaceae bacterium]|nr:hypothetical protein [Polyangiaceae bacterium]
MRTRIPALSAVLLLAFGASAWAQDGDLPLRVAPSSRTSPADPPGSLPRQEPKAPAPAPAKPTRPAHQKGPAPKTPADRLPEGSPRGEADPSSRRAVADGPTKDQAAEGPDDPELVALREADQVLFPTELRGVEPGWSWDLPEAKPGAEVTRGLPPRPRLPVDGADVARADAEWLRTLTMPDLPVRLDRRVVTYLKFYRDSPRGRTIAAIWARKSGRYTGALKAELRRAGLPPDLVWLSMIE